MMKFLALGIAAVAVAWSGFWLAGYWGATAGVSAWFDARQADGWVAEYDDLSVRGYPSRLDTTLTGLSLADPQTGVAWDTPFFQFFALTYKPNHLIAVWPHTQTLSIPAQKLTIETADMRASLIVEPGTTLAPQRANLALEQLQISSTANWRLAATALNLAAQKLPDTTASYKVALQAEDLTPPAGFALSSEIDLPRSFTRFRADLTATFDRPWDITAIEQERPQPTSISLTVAEMVWGTLELRAAGAVTVEASGLLSGEITIRAVNWRTILDVARHSDQMPSALLNTVEQGLGFVAKLSGNANELDIPLTFKGGTTRLGPVPIGPAPRLILR